MATLALNLRLWVSRLLIGRPVQGRCPASEVNDGASPENPVKLRLDRLTGLSQCSGDDDVDSTEVGGVKALTGGAKQNESLIAEIACKAGVAV